MRSEEDIREDILFSDWWMEAFSKFGEAVEAHLKYRRRLFNELLQRQMNYFEDD